MTDLGIITPTLGIIIQILLCTMLICSAVGRAGDRIVGELRKLREQEERSAKSIISALDQVDHEVS